MNGEAITSQEQVSRNALRRSEIERGTMRLWPDAGRRLGIGRAATYEAAKRNQIPTIRIGRKILVPVAALERMLA
jgi:excisionase family DNA binding protein